MGSPRWNSLNQSKEVCWYLLDKRGFCIFHTWPAEQLLVHAEESAKLAENQLKSHMT